MFSMSFEIINNAIKTKKIMEVELTKKFNLTMEDLDKLEVKSPITCYKVKNSEVIISYNIDSKIWQLNSKQLKID